MVSLLAVYQVALVVAGVACLGIAAYAWRMESTRGQRTLIGLFLAIDAWIAVSLLVTVVAGTPIATTIFAVQLFGMTLVPPFAVLSGLQYTGRDKYITRKVEALLAVQPVAVAIGLWIPEIRRIAYRIGPPDPSTFYGYQITFDWLLYVNVLWAYLLLAVATTLFLEFAVRAESVYKRQATATVVAVLAPWIGNALFLLGPIEYDLTALGFFVTGLAIWWAIYAEDLLNVMPVAKTTVMENVDAGFLVLNWQDRVVDVNPQARSMLDIDETADVVGASATAVLADAPAVRDAVGQVSEKVHHTETEIRTGGRDLQITATTLNDDYGRRLGRLILLEDITDQKHRQRELERKNERLEEFAGVVSHDLRNPLTVASGELELARIPDPEDLDSLAAARDRIEATNERLDDATAALDRMDAIIDDVLALARGGEAVETTEAVALSAIADDAWANVDGTDATLTVDGDRTLQADADRLQRAFENLFRNSVEHGPDDVTVTVGATEDGFYVADDGFGVPPAKRDEIFESGYTTNEDGTGFGLPIVRDIVQAHGWSIDVTESESGGARFEITGLTESSPAPKATQGRSSE